MVISFLKNTSLYIFLLIFCTEHITYTVSDHDFYNLEVIARDNQPNLISFLDRTRTNLGTQIFKKQCLKLEYSPELLIAQQQAVSTFLVDKTLTKTTIALLDQFHHAEKAFDTFQASSNATTQALYDDLYFKKDFLKKFNNSPAALLSGQFLPLLGLVIPTVEHILVHMGLQQLTNNHSHKHKHHHGHKHKHGHACATCTASSFFPKSIATAIQAAHWAMHGAVIAGVGYEMVQKMQLCKKLQEDLIAIATCIHIAQKLSLEMCKHKTLSHYFPQLKRITDLIHGKCGTQELMHFMDLIQKNTFKGSTTLCSHIGNILVAHRLLYQVKDELLESLSIIGSIDMLVSIAQLMQEHEHHNNQYTFAHYTQSALPYISISATWHPLAQQPCTHDIRLDGNSISHMIITGNNGSGKSMYLKTAGICIWMAQTLGIVPARYAILTPFTDIITAMHVHDSTAQGSSYFMSELAHGQACLQRIEQCTQQNTFCCCLVDEFFRGTGYEKAYATAQLFLTQLTEHANCISLTATHLHELATLATQKPNLEAWHMAAIADATQKQYKITRGVFKHHPQEQILGFK